MTIQLYPNCLSKRLETTWQLWTGASSCWRKSLTEYRVHVFGAQGWRYRIFEDIRFCFSMKSLFEIQKISITSGEIRKKTIFCQTVLNYSCSYFKIYFKINDSLLLPLFLLYKMALSNLKSVILILEGYHQQFFFLMDAILNFCSFYYHFLLPFQWWITSYPYSKYKKNVFI